MNSSSGSSIGNFRISWRDRLRPPSAERTGRFDWAIKAPPSFPARPRRNLPSASVPAHRWTSWIYRSKTRLDTGRTLALLERNVAIGAGFQATGVAVGEPLPLAGEGDHAKHGGGGGHKTVRGAAPSVTHRVPPSPAGG